MPDPIATASFVGLGSHGEDYDVVWDGPEKRIDGTFTLVITNDKLSRCVLLDHRLDPVPITSPGYCAIVSAIVNARPKRHSHA